MKAVILAAGIGSRLGDETRETPKPLIDINGRSLLFRQLDRLAAAGISGEDVVVVGGYRIEQIRSALSSAGFRCKLVVNERFEPPWGNYLSLAAAENELRGHPFLQFDGDLVMDETIVPGLLAAPGEALLATDTTTELDGDAMKVELDDNGVLVSLDKVKVNMAKVLGEYIGLTKLSARAGAAVFDELRAFQAEGLQDEYYDRSYERLSRRGTVPFGAHILATTAVWREIDDAVDLADARKKFV